MADYYVNGYTPPKGVNSRDKVRQIQATLGVKQDGIWGPNTQAAWVTQGFGNIWKPDVPTSPAPSTPNRVVEGPAQTLNSASKQLTRSNQTDTGVKQTQAQSTQNALQRNPLLSSNLGTTRLPNVSGAAQGLNSSPGTNPLSQPATASTPAIWSGRLQEDWNAFLASQVQRGDGIDAVPTTPRNRAAEEMLAKLSTGMEKAASIQPSSPQPKPHVQAAPSQYEIDRASHMLSWGVSNLIHDARLTEYERERASAFTNELSPQQLNIVANWINESGAEKLFRRYELKSTAEKLVKETSTPPVQLEISQELTQPSYLRPQINDYELDRWQTDYADISFSNYYYLDGEYHVKIYNKGIEVAEFSLGKVLPQSSVVQAQHAYAAFAMDQLRLGFEMMATPQMITDAFLTYYFGDNLFTSLPGVEEFYESIDPWDHKARVSEDDIMITMDATYRSNPSTFNPRPASQSVRVGRRLIHP